MVGDVAIAATLGNTLNIKPLFTCYEEGKIRAVKKIRGRHKAIWQHKWDVL